MKHSVIPAFAYLFVYAPLLVAQNPHHLPVSFPGGSLQAVGDVDGDGDLDLVRFLSGVDQFEVLRNDGGYVWASASLTAHDPLADPATARLGDLDGDGFLDVVVAHSGGVDAHFGGPSCTFGVPVSLPGTGSSFELEDGDGNTRLDVALVEPQGGGVDGVRWVRQQGAGFVADPLYLNAGAISDLAVLYADGDALADLAICTPGSSQVGLLRTIAGVLTPFGSLSPGVSATPDLSVVRADLDGDGDDDLVAVDGGTNPPIWTTFLNTAGSFTLADTATLLDRAKLTGIMGADWDGDGDDDLVVPRSWFSSSTFGFMLLESASGVLSEGFDQFLSGEATPVGSGDVDGDGLEDVVVEDCVVYGTGTELGPIPFESDWSLGLFPIDWEGDGDLDLIPDNLRNDGSGDFTDVGELGPQLPPPYMYGNYLAPTWFEDFDGDGLRDALAVVICQGCGPWGSDEYATWMFPGLPTDGLDPTPVITSSPLGGEPADVDGDGDPDMVDNVCALWINDGTGRFTRSTPISCGRRCDLGDVEPDGDVDILFRSGTFSWNDVKLFRNNGGVFVEELVYTPTDDLIHGTTSLVDLDGDGDLDVAAGEWGDFTAGAPRSLVLVENTGSGFGTVRYEPTGMMYYAIEFGDVDADGKLDILVKDRDVSSMVCDVELHLSGGQAGFAWDVPDHRVLFPNYVAVVDADADGDADLVSPILEGSKALKNRTLAPPSGAQRLQFGVGSPGLGSAVPVLGASGPLRPGETIEIRLRYARGGAIGLLAIGRYHAAYPNVPFSGNTLYVDPVGLVSLQAKLLGGTADAAGLGLFNVPQPVSASLVGSTFTLQAFVLDADSPNGRLASSNGLVVTIGV